MVEPRESIFDLIFAEQSRDRPMVRVRRFAAAIFAAGLAFGLVTGAAFSLGVKEASLSDRLFVFLLCCCYGIIVLALTGALLWFLARKNRRHGDLFSVFFGVVVVGMLPPFVFFLSLGVPLTLFHVSVFSTLFGGLSVAAFVLWKIFFSRFAKSCGLVQD